MKTGGVFIFTYFNYMLFVDVDSTLQWLPQVKKTPHTAQERASIRSTQINLRLIRLVSWFNEMKWPIDLSERLKQCRDPETWSDLIIESMIYNLTPRSNYWRFWTPDADIVRAVTRSKPNWWVYAKILGTKIDTLFALQSWLEEDRMVRIRLIHWELGKHYQRIRI